MNRQVHLTRRAPVGGPAAALPLIVVPALNEAANIRRVIAELLRDDLDARLVVADGGSSDATVGVVERIAGFDSRVSCIYNPGRIQSAAVNLAVRLRGEGAIWLIRADAHAIYPPGYVADLIAEGKRTGAASVVVAMETRAAGCFARGVAAAQNSVLGNGGAAHRWCGKAGWVDHGHHALMRIDAFTDAGGYDEAFSHNEDAELDVRLRARGGRIWLTDRTHITYHPRGTAGGLWRQYHAYGRGRAATLTKHGLRPKLRQALPLLVPPAILAAVLGVGAGLAVPAFGVLTLPALLWSAGCCAYGAGLALGRRARCVLWAGPAAMIMHLAWALGFLRATCDARRGR